MLTDFLAPCPHNDDLARLTDSCDFVENRYRMICQGCYWHRLTRLVAALDQVTTALDRAVEGIEKARKINRGEQL